MKILQRMFRPAAWCLVFFGIIGSAASIPGCGLVGSTVTTVHEEVFTVPRDTVDALLEPVVLRIDEYDEEGLFTSDVDAALLGLSLFEGDYPAYATVHVSTICDAHDITIATHPTAAESPLVEHWMRSTAILRALFAAVNEPILPEAETE